MNTTPDEWKKVAFSYKQIGEFLQIAALSQSDAMDLFQGRSPQLRCFGVGFYFFANSIKGELQPEFGNALHTLACRVEQECLHSTLGSWPLNAEEATRLLDRYFSKAQQGVPPDVPAAPSGRQDRG